MAGVLARGVEQRIGTDKGPRKRTGGVGAGAVASGLFFASINGEQEPVPGPMPASFTVASVMFNVLASPYGQVRSMLQPMPGLRQILLFASNSVLWGGVVSAIIRYCAKRPVFQAPLDPARVLSRLRRGGET